MTVYKVFYYKSDPQTPVMKGITKEISSKTVLVFCDRFAKRIFKIN